MMKEIICYQIQHVMVRTHGKLPKGAAQIDGLKWISFIISERITDELIDAIASEKDCGPISIQHCMLKY